MEGEGSIGTGTRGGGYIPSCSIGMTLLPPFGEGASSFDISEIHYFRTV
jgi:hypothetical protein